MAALGGSLRTSTSLLSPDGSRLLVACGAAVRVHSALTGDRLAVLEGHSASVTAICRHLRNEALIYTAALDGSIILWDYERQAIEGQWAAGRPIESMAITGRHTAVLSVHWSDRGTGRVVVFDLATPGGDDADGEQPPRSGEAARGKGEAIVCKLQRAAALAVSPNRAFVAAVDGPRVVVVCMQHGRKVVTMLHTRALTCVEFDSRSQHVAAGDVSGRIVVWSGLPAAAQRAAAAGGPPPDARTAGMKVFEPPHWHAHPVGALCFSHDGAYLLSGGRENVLVIWQLESMHKTFLPRLGGPLTHIGRCPGDAAVFVVGQQDNALRVVSLAQMAVLTSVYGVRPAAPGLPPRAADAGCCLQPGSGYLALPARGGSVQLYDVARDRHVERLQVVARNDVSPTVPDGAAAAQPAEPAVRFAAFSHDAATLVTAEARPTAATPAAAAQRPLEFTLKFWDAHTRGGTPAGFTVNTAVSDPHTGDVTALAMRPDAQEAVTAGVRRAGAGGGEWRRWVRRRVRLGPAAAADAPAWDWVCASVGTYRDLPFSAVAYSGDGTVLAAGGGALITLWNPDSNALGATLVAPAHARKSHVTQLAFLEGSPHLVSAHGGRDACVCVWSVETLDLVWCTLADVVDVAPHPTRPLFAAAISQGGGQCDVVAVLTPESAVAEQTWLLRRGARASRALFVAPDTALSNRLHGKARGPAQQLLLVLTEDREIAVLSTEGGDALSPGDAAADGRAEAERSQQRGERGAGVDGLFGSVPAGGLGSKRGGVSAELRPESLQALFDAPSHLLPDTGELCESVLQLLLRRPDAA